METLAEKLRIIEGFSVYGSIDLDSLTNFPQVIMPPKFKALEFVKYNGIAPEHTCSCSIGKWLPAGIIALCFARFFLIV